MGTISNRAAGLTAVALLTGFTLSAQSVISVHSGVLHVTEGAVYVNGQPVNQKLGTFPELKEKAVLRTELGRAEVLLTPGVFLRVGENSSVKMVDNRLSDTRVELLSGQIVVESDDPMKENSVTILYKDYQVHVRKAGVLEFQANPEQLRVYHGEAEVEADGTLTVVKAGRLMPFTAALAQEKFDSRNSGDELTRWSQQRSEYVSVANLSAAKSLRDSGSTWSNGNWYYNSFYSMYTYVPMNGIYWNPYGYGFFSPYTVYQVYNPAYYYGGNGGYGSGGGATSSRNTTFSARPRNGISTSSGQPSFGNTNTGEPSFGRGSYSGGSTPSAGVATSGPSFGGAGAGPGGSAGGGAGRSAGGGRSR